MSGLDPAAHNGAAVHLGAAARNAARYLLLLLPRESRPMQARAFHLVPLISALLVLHLLLKLLSILCTSHRRYRKEH